LEQQVSGKLKRSHGLVLSGEAREAGHRVEDWRWEGRRVRSSGAERFGGGVVAAWTDDERREFEHAYAKQRAEQERPAETMFRAGDVVDTPGGPAYVVEMALGGYEVKLFSDLPEERFGHHVNPLSRDGALYMPNKLLRRAG
jgi:hypothetical protein